MHDPKFEKDVQQKMEELVFTPPASVWLNVEKEVNKENKRRFLPFWLFFLPASLLVGAGIIYFSGSKRKSQATDTAINAVIRPVPSQPSTHPADAQPGGSQPQPAGALSAAPGNPGSAPSRPDPVDPRGSGSSLPPVKIQLKKDKNLIINRQASRMHKTAEQEEFHSGQPMNDYSHGETAGLPRRPGTGPIIRSQHPDPAAVETSAPVQPAKPEVNNTIESDSLTMLAGKTGPAAQPFVHRSVSPQRSAIDRHAGAIAASPLSAISKSPAAAKTRLPEPRRPWVSGFAGGIGVSSLNQGLLDKSSVTSAAYANYFSAITGVPQTYVSNAQPDLSFWAGVLLQKSLRKDLSMSLGLNLHYYSSRIKTGKKVNSDLAGLQSPSTTPNNSFILGNGGLAAAGRAYPYYSPGNNETFTNRYYFLELPGSISWQVGHSKTMPLFWEGGFSLSYLVSSNSLYYNPKSGVFFKDGSVINRTQASVFTGLMVGLPLHGLRIQAGPQIQYGFTNLLNNQGTAGQHLLYGGIKFVFLPGKWNK